MLHRTITIKKRIGQKAPPFTRNAFFGNFSRLRANIKAITTIKIVMILNKTPRLTISLTKFGNRQMMAEIITVIIRPISGCPYLLLCENARGRTPSSADA